jgi:Na+/H+ antiporter NhaD/arsenite permease-like protein
LTLATGAGRRRRWAGVLLLGVAGDAGASGLDGAALSLLWALPFASILLAIALGPLLAAAFWHRHYGKVSAACAAAFLLPFAEHVGVGPALQALAHTLVAEFIPFILLLTALYATAGGIYIRGNLRGSPAVNTALLGIGTALASVIGTTGAAMLLIRPLLRANDARRHRTHVVIFFIFLVANIGGSLTPLGDPPLFLGFLKGVDFFWTTRAMLGPMLVSAIVLLVVFYFLDRWFFRQEDQIPVDPTPDAPIRIEGWINVLVFGPAVLAAVLMSGLWQPGIKVTILGTPVELQDLVRNLALAAITLLSLWFTSSRIRADNHFEWGPMVEVGKLFAGIFVTIVPVIAILQAENAGALAPLVALVSDPSGAPIDWVYFWLTGALSSFLDNAPTYLVFFNLAGGDAQVLMGPLASTLTAISAGAVFMGANTYIGNAPNFMVRAVALSRGVPMPSFFGYMAWSGAFLLPLYLLLTFLFFV